MRTKTERQVFLKLTSLYIDIFKKTIRENKEFQGREYHLFAPTFDKTQNNWIITICDQQTGFLIPISIKKDELRYTDITVLSLIYLKVMKLLVKSIMDDHNKSMNLTNPKETPIKNGMRRVSVFDHKEELEGKTILNVFVWSKIIIG